MTASGARALPFAYRLAVAIVRPLMHAAHQADVAGHGEPADAPAASSSAPTTCPTSTRSPSRTSSYDNGHPPYFLGKEEVFRIPVVGRDPARRRADPGLPQHRPGGRRVPCRRGGGRRAASASAIYPEGTLTRDPDLWPMVGKTGAARIALATQCPVIPVAQWGPQEMLAPYSQAAAAVPAHDDAGARRAARRPRATSTTSPSPAPLLREATDRIMAAITAELEVLRGEKAPVGAVRLAQARARPRPGNFHRPRRRPA